MASTTSLAWPLPSAPSTFRLIKCAAGAMPLCAPSAVFLKERAATMPAMCVPWPYSSRPRPRRSVKSTLATTRPLSAGWSAIPLSIMATPIPRPSTAPSVATAPDHAASAPVVRVVTAMCECTTGSPDSASTSSSCDSESIAPFDAVNTAPELSSFFTTRPWRFASRSMRSCDQETMMSMGADDPELRCATRSDDNRARRPPAAAGAAHASTTAAIINRAVEPCHVGRYPRPRFQPSGCRFTIRDSKVWTISVKSNSSAGPKNRRG